MHEDVVVERARVMSGRSWKLRRRTLRRMRDFFTHMSVMGVDIDTIVTWRYDVQAWDERRIWSLVSKSWGSDVIDRNTGSHSGSHR